MADRTPHILLIDDDPDMHDVVRLILEPHGYRVTACATTHCGRDVIANDPPDLVLLDIMLATPTEGLEFAGELRGDPKLAELPIIMVSCATRQTAVPAAFEPAAALFNVFLEKPLECRQLRDTVAYFAGRA